MNKLSIIILLISFFVLISIEFVIPMSYQRELSTTTSKPNNPPTTTLNSPTDLIVLNERNILFSWRYYDKDNDPQTFFALQVDDDSMFNSPLLELRESSQTIQELLLPDKEGLYYWRVKTKDLYEYGKWSEVRSFYLDLSPKLCSDNTYFYQCSIIKPRYCDGGLLVDDCAKCGCPSNSFCQSDGLCNRLTCLDDTPYGGCSYEKPKYCRNGALIEICSLCGCSENQECQSDGTCIAKQPIITEPEITKTEPKTFWDKLLYPIRKFCLRFK